MQYTNSTDFKKNKKLSKNSYFLIDKELKKYPSDQKKSAVIASLVIAQREKGFISPEIEEEIGNYLEMPPIAVHEIATFYNMFEVKPKAKFKMVICTNLPCALRNSKHAITILKNRLGIGIGETTDDNLFSLHEGECFGACADAPVMLVNNHKMFSWMNEYKIDAVIRDLSSSESNDTKFKEKS
jgi:NADH-quinone oxidoreductase subunit E